MKIVNGMKGNYVLEKDCASGDLRETVRSDPREPAQIELAIHRLHEVLDVNRGLSKQIQNMVFHPRPVEPNCEQKITSEPTLASMIHQIADYVVETNGILDDVSRCLDSQLGSIRLD